MSTFCGGNGTAPAMSSSEMQQIFPDGILPSGFPDMKGGLADESWLESYVNSLKSSGKVPTPPEPKNLEKNMFNAPETKDPLAAYVKKENDLQMAIRNEYCFYEKRYFAALNIFLQNVADSSLGNNSNSGVQTNLNNTLTLNKKLTLLTQIVNRISKYRYDKTKEFQSNINTVNNQIIARREVLLKQNEILASESATADINKRMVEYTIEKNKANQNLLALYGVLNIFALAIVVYISRT
jgi:hypothetical protein